MFVVLVQGGEHKETAGSTTDAGTERQGRHSAPENVTFMHFYGATEREKPCFGAFGVFCVFVAGVFIFLFIENFSVS